MSRSHNPKIRYAVAAVVLGALGAAGVWFFAGRQPSVPEPGSAEYEQVTKHFYRGLAALQVGLTEGAKEDFTRATAVVPNEPAPWANLGLANLRLSDLDGAAAALDRAASLAPNSADIAFLRARLETARGRRDEAIQHLRQAVALEPDALYARSALAQEIENAGGPGADDEAQSVLEELASRVPGNAAVILDRARLAAKRGDAVVLRDSVARLGAFASTWPAEVQEQFAEVVAADRAANTADAARALAFLRNVLAPVPGFRESRRAVVPPAETMADPVVRFLRLVTPAATPAEADDALAFDTTVVAPPGARAWQRATVFGVGEQSAVGVFGSDDTSWRRLDGQAAGGASPMSVSGPAGSGGLLVLDWNHDFRQDVVTSGVNGLRLFLQTETGGFLEAPSTTGAQAVNTPAHGAWAADIEMDGDVDIVLGVIAGPAVVLRNNGDGTWQRQSPFASVVDAAGFAWGDLDIDGDPDAVFLDGKGIVRTFSNVQGGQFREAPPTGLTAAAAITLGDVDADGAFEIVAFGGDGTIQSAALMTDGWRVKSLARWDAVPAGLLPGRGRIFLADLDNNGALDVLSSTESMTRIWLARADLSFQPLAANVAGAIWQAADLDANGLLDLVGVSDGAVVRHMSRSARGYHWQDVRPRAQTAAGDQRINSFGIGGDVEVRSGRLVQKQPIAGEVVHFGLGANATADVTRIVWPNGVPQAEFDPAVDETVVAEQRLKGSCPWIFADNGTEMAFVTDFLWRSPLGLKINASDTAGVTQTEDWIRIRGDQLVERNGAYDVRMTAELWETHFVDHVALMVVDHPADVDVFVDERFVPVLPPALELHQVRGLRPVSRAWDQTGRDVTDIVGQQDGRHLGSFERGRYQGVATDHYVEFDLGQPVDAVQAHWLVARGWIYPTDSSINVAIGQGRHSAPESLSLEAQDQAGRWVVVRRGLGFPAGKNKTVLIDLSGARAAGLAQAQRFRLRTNLEIYWDQISTAKGAPEVNLRTTRLAPEKADLRYRGFSVTRTERRDEPETPVYQRLATATPRWRDLVGFYTRHGDVRELLKAIDDRYVIMNAGDEMRFSFHAPPPPPDGWTRDFVLIGDGWVKDGDFNTSYAKTVLPLPEHGRSDYVALDVEPTLSGDPVFRRHASDWQNFHTRYVEPLDFLQGARFDAPVRR